MDHKLSRRDALKAGTLGLAAGLAGASVPSRVLASALDAGATDVSFATYQWGEPSFAKFFTQAAQAYHAAHPNIQIVKPTTPYTQYWDKILVELQSGSPSDLYQGSFELLPQYVAMGVLEPLDSYLGGLDMSQFQPAQHMYSRFGGKTYGLVLLNCGFSLIYNKDHFKAAGLALPRTPAEVLTTAKKLTNAPKQYGIAVMNTVTDELIPDINNWLFGWAPGANWTKPDGTPDLLNKNVQETLTFYKALLDSGAVPMGTPKTDYRNLMAQGRVSMMVDGPWYFGFYPAKQLASLGAVATPTPTHVTPLADNVFMIPKHAHHKVEAADFLKSWFTRSMQELYVKITLSPPGFKNVMPAGFLAQNPWYKPYAQYAGKTVLGTPPGFLTTGNQAAHILTDVASAILFSHQPMATALADGNAKLAALRKQGS